MTELLDRLSDQVWKADRLFLFLQPELSISSEISEYTESSEVSLASKLGNGASILLKTALQHAAARSIRKEVSSKKSKLLQNPCTRGSKL